MKKILLLNGPNLGCLGKREPRLYGRSSLSEIVRQVKARGRALGVRVDDFQSNEEGVLVTRILGSAGVYAGLIFNPGAYTHTSIALRDALQAVRIPCVEVHLSNIAAREDFRQINLTAGACLGQVTGFGSLSYTVALTALVDYLNRRSGRRR